MKLNRWAIALYVGLVFGSGAVLGAFVHRAITTSEVSANTPRNPEEFRKRFQVEMRTRLKLTDDQAAKLEKIMEETRARFRETRSTIEPEMQRIRQEQQERIHAILDAEQDIEWDQIRRERDEHIRQRGGWVPAQAPPASSQTPSR